MGFRYRKSINLGGGFRINLSKSGVGYSWGTKGYRVTKTAKNKIRRTVSIPGTGISHVNETGGNSSDKSRYKPAAAYKEPVETVNNNHYDTQDITNNVTTEMVSEGLEYILASASRILKLNKISSIGFWLTLILGLVFPAFLVFTIIFLVLNLFVKLRGTIELNYEIENEQKYSVDKQMNPIIKIANCNKVWRIMQTSKVANKKYSGGANNTVNRTVCKATIKAPFPFKVNSQVASFKVGEETLLFLPDKLFIIQGSRVGALNYSDITAKSHTNKFIEDETIPSDAQIIDKTWKYVNKSGGPDKRFKNNKQLPICLYGELELKSDLGLNTVIMFSNPNINN